MTELPYFKFFPSEWLTGQISFEDHSVKGAFVDLISFYWTKGCKMNEEQMKKVTKRQHKYILDSGIVKIVDKQVKIDFLDTQLQDRLKVYEAKSKAGKMGGRPKKFIDPYLKQAYETK